jgi:AcrR family transcriptional regulator
VVESRQTEGRRTEGGSIESGRRERKKRETRQALQEAALALVARRGLAHVTVEDIADAADVSVRTFFNYFPSKLAAVIAEDPDSLEAMKRHLLSLPPEVGPLEGLRAVMLARAREMGTDASAWRTRVAIARVEPEVHAAFGRSVSALEQVLADALVERLGGDERFRLYASVAAACTTAGMRVAAMRWGGRGGAQKLVELASEALDLVARGLPQPEAVA